MKITADMLTEEMGFVELALVYVKYIRSTGLSGVNAYCWDKQGEESAIKYCDDILELKPLTGPMSIWNHAPDYAESVYVTQDGDIEWLGSVVDDECIPRPWWAVKKGEKASELR